MFVSQVEKVIEVPVTIEKRVEVAVPYEKIVHIEVPVEKIVYRDVPVPVQMTPERVVTKEIPQVCTDCKHHARSLMQMPVHGRLQTPCLFNEKPGRLTL